MACPGEARSGEHKVHVNIMLRGAPVPDFRTNTEESKYLVVKGPPHTEKKLSTCCPRFPTRETHRRYLCLSSRSALSCIRAVSFRQSPGRISIHQRIPPWGAAFQAAPGTYQITPRQMIRNPITYETIRYPQTSIEQPHTANDTPDRCATR